MKDSVAYRSNFVGGFYNSSVFAYKRIDNELDCLAVICHKIWHGLDIFAFIGRNFMGKSGVCVAYLLADTFCEKDFAFHIDELIFDG